MAQGRNGEVAGLSRHDIQVLQARDLVLKTRPHGFLGGHLSATLAFTPPPAVVWHHLIDYPRWVEYLPDMCHSEILAPTPEGHTRVRQIGQKTIFGFNAQAELELRMETEAPYQLRCHMEKGCIGDFRATFMLRPWRQGCLLTFTGQAVPLFPVPGFMVEHVLRQGIPDNLRHMRRRIESYGA
jgi:hypothetical protein